ncbi:Growth hormone secretagogue receptor type 1 [Channa argus]|uniref:Growth hormone secretagogue receptor type 1 n=1 Tax=Channa argus TaxID=215402 RepID=A0A6G1QBX4_CHAAH|nr:Growth hormone secretagogue receptor type 1 [Channa argus]
MDHVELEDMGSGCEDENCGLTLGFTEDCVNQECPVLGLIELERYLAVCWPITAKTLLTRRKTRALIGCLWLCAAISAAPVLVMVGVEEVGGKDEGISGWREDRGWMDRLGEQERIIIGADNMRSGPMSSMDRGLQVVKWDENETKGWDERIGEFEEKGERIGEIEEKKEGNGGEKIDGKQADEHGVEQKGNMEVDKTKEDEGRGREDGFGGSPGGETDKRECRCLDYAATSGLLPAMMILSNLYFLIPVCILGLVYSLIGRTLWLRPQSSRKDQSHQHTVKMLGVIVLAFVLCWLPFHVGRTIFSLSFSTSADTQETHVETNSQLDTNWTLSTTMDRGIKRDTISEPMNHMQTLSKTGQLIAQSLSDDCDTCTKGKIRHNTSIKVDTHLGNKETENHTYMDTNSDDRSTDQHFYSYIISHASGHHRSLDTNVPNLHPSRETNTHTPTRTEMHKDPTRVLPDNQTQNNTSTATHDKRNRTPISTDPPNDTPSTTRRPNAAGIRGVTPSNQYNHNTHSDVRFNNSHTHPDKHMVFYYFLSQYFNLVASVLFYLSAAINPLLYNLMSARYRHAVHSLIHTHSQTQSHRLRKTLPARHSTTTL